MNQGFTLLWLIVALSGCWGASLPAQDRSNPFEIPARLPAATNTDAAADTALRSPFDVRRNGAGSTAASTTATAPAPLAPLVIQSTDPDEGRGSILAIQLSMLLALTGLWVLFGDFLRQVFRGTVNDSMMTQVYTRRSGGEVTALWLCYIFFFFVVGFYLYQLATHFNVSLNTNVWVSWLTYSLAVAAAVGLRHWVLFIFARLFPVRKEVSRYAFVMMVFSILAGIFIVPVNLGVAYAPPAYRSAFLYLGLVVFLLVYLFHLLRGWLIAQRLGAVRPAHILLYICTIEIAPLLLVYRYLETVLR